MPEVSIIIPTYNRARKISRAIKSALAQTFQDFEIIVVDDASTDSTEAIVRGFQDGRIVFTRHQKNKGAAEARNTGIKMSKGDFIAFLDDDDEWMPQKLQKQLEVFQDNGSNLGVVYSGYVRIDDVNKKILDTWFPAHRGNVYEKVLAFGWMVQPSLLVRKSCFDQCGLFDETLSVGEDGDMQIRLSQVYQFDYVPEVLVRIYPSNKDMVEPAIKSGQILLNKYSQELKKRPKIRALFHIWIATYYCQKKDVVNARRHLIEAIQVCKFYPKLYIHLILTFLGANWYLTTNRRWKQLSKIFKKHLK